MSRSLLNSTLNRWLSFLVIWKPGYASKDASANQYTSDHVGCQEIWAKPFPGFQQGTG
jgi:hypothetical protein